MIQPNIIYYARLDDTTGDRDTLKYSITSDSGIYEPLKHLVGRDGRVSFDLIDKRELGADGVAGYPSMRLQGKNSLNVTGLYDYLIGGKLSGIAYGTPLDKPTYSKKNRVNPFYNHRKDGFLFVMHFSEEALLRDPRTANLKEIRPDYIEMMVLEGAVKFVGSYCTQLQSGGFNDVLDEFRKRAIPRLTKEEFLEAMKAVDPAETTQIFPNR